VRTSKQALVAAPVDGDPLLPFIPVTVSAWLATEPEVRHREVDGTLVFADVSGFTPLSERLARRGKVGSEQLTDILNELFGELIELAAERGGDLLKFGGDALLLLFSGPQHAARAVAAADQLQDALTRHARVDTGSGVVTLRMSIGVHSGPVQLFLVGASHRELIVTGETAARTCAMEAAAAAGEVLLSPETAALLDHAWVGRQSGPGRLLRRRRAVLLAPVRPRAHPTGLTAALAVPSGLRQHLQDGQVWGEHRQATVAFLQFSGVDRVLAEAGVDGLATALDELVTVVQRATEKHDVCFLATDVDAAGGKVLLSAGAPRSAGHDEDRMLHALKSVVDAGTRLDVRVGAHRGHAFAVGVGGSSRRSFSVMGDVVNLAARVMGKAPPGQVLVTDDLTANLRGGFALEPVPPFHVKGKTAAVSASLVLGTSGQRRDTASADLPLVGRADELRALHDAWGDARAGQGSVLVVTGDPGLGKTRLVSHALTAAGRARRLVVDGTPYGATSPYFALRLPLRRLLGPATSDEGTAAALAEHVRRWAPALDPWLPLLALPFGLQLPDTPETEQLEERFRGPQLHAVVSELLAGLLPGPALVVVEDAHWLDDASSELLRHALTSVSERGWLALVTRRALAGGLYADPDDDVRPLPLRPLAASETAALAAQLTDDAPLPPGALQSVVDRSGGNPLFLAELVRAVRAGGTAESLPGSVEALLVSRIDDLEHDDRALLRDAAVLGGRFPLWLLQTVVSRDDERDVRDAVGGPLRDFLAVDGATVRFHNALTREVAYEALPYRLRRERHLLAGEALEQVGGAGTEPAFDLLSLHFFEAQVLDKAWHYSCLAAERARARAGLVEATALYQRAVACAHRLTELDPADLAQVSESLGDVAEKCGQYDVAATAYREARALCRHDRLATVRLCGKEGWLRERSGSFADALRWYTRGRRLLGDPDDHESRRAQAHLVLSYGAARLRQGRYRQCVPYLEQAVAEAQAVDDRPTLAHAYYLLDWAHTDLGHGAVGGYRDSALRIYEELGDLSGQANTLNNLGVGAYYEGRWQAALDFYRRSRDARRACGDAVQLGEASNNIAEILSDQGHLDSAAELLRDALRLWRGARFPIGTGLATSNLGRVRLRLGDLDAAGELFASAREVLTGIGARRLALETDAREAERLVALSAPVEALSVVELAQVQAGQLGGIPVLAAMLDRVAGYAYLQLGDLEAAEERLRTSTRTAREARASFELALSLTALARVHRLTGTDPTPEAEEAAVHLQRLGVVALTAFPLEART
jgi:class 3 adenylate cyclase/tetratricopeptide (TPR) repeat protein